MSSIYVHSENSENTPAMKRTPEAFAREAPKDGPYELEVGKKSAYPKPYSDMTYPQRKEHARLLDAWANAAREGKAEVPTKADGSMEMEPVEFVMRFRFGSLAKDKDGQWAPASTGDFDAFQKEWVEKLPWTSVSKMFDEVDDYYDPTPATDQEKAEAAADPDGDTAGKSESAGAS